MDPKQAISSPNPVHIICKQTPQTTEKGFLCLEFLNWRDAFAAVRCRTYLAGQAETEQGLAVRFELPCD